MIHSVIIGLALVLTHLFMESSKKRGVLPSEVPPLFIAFILFSMIVSPWFFLWHISSLVFSVV